MSIATNPLQVLQQGLLSAENEYSTLDQYLDDFNRIITSYSTGTALSKESHRFS